MALCTAAAAAVAAASDAAALDADRGPNAWRSECTLLSRSLEQQSLAQVWRSLKTAGSLYAPTEISGVPVAAPT